MEEEYGLHQQAGPSQVAPWQKVTRYDLRVIPDLAGREGSFLPESPQQHEKFEAFRRQKHRWLAIATLFASLGSVYGIWAVFSKSWDWLPLMASLLITVPWSLYGVYLIWQKPQVNRELHSKMLLDSGLDFTSVDVMITTCGEELHVLENTMAHVARLTWLGTLTSYVLDDSARPEVAYLAARYGLKYLARPDRGRMKKAGNLNYGLSQSGGEFVVAFDADFAPCPDFLLQMIPHFGDPSVGIIQTAQYFDTDSRRTRNWIQQHAGIVQEMFFAWIQPARDALGVAFCVGTNVGYRRSALESADNIPEVPGGEDIVTTWDLMKIGYRTMYLPLNLAKGLCPDTFDATAGQQYRWASSSMMIIAGSRDNRTRRAFWDCKMTVAQRISFFAGIFYYLQSILALIITVAPSLVMLWWYPYQIGPGNYLPILPGMLGFTVMPVILHRWRPALLRLAIVYSAVHAIALWDVVFGTEEAWIPTNAAPTKKKRRTAHRAGLLVRTWVILTQGFEWWGIARDLPVYGWPAYWPAVFLAAVQAAILLPLLLPNFGTRTQK